MFKFVISFVQQEKNVEPVIRDMVDALIKVYPKSRYLEASMSDKTVAFLSHMLPTSLSDRLILSYQNQLLRLYGKGV